MGILEGVFTLKNILINWGLGILLVEFALFMSRTLRKVDEERDGQYPGLRRYDCQKKLWKRHRLYLGNFLLFYFSIGAWMIIPKVLFCTTLLLATAVICKLLLVTNDKKKPYPMWKRKIIDNVFMVLCRGMLLTPNMFWLHKTRCYLDYSKYLGPDFKQEYDSATTIIGNHASWMVR